MAVCSARSCCQRPRRVAIAFLLVGLCCCSISQFAVVWRHSEAFAVRRHAADYAPLSRTHELTWKEYGLSWLWGTVTRLGPRRVAAAIRTLAPQYADTVFCYSPSEYPGTQGLVALTIDDGICRQGGARSMLREVLGLLENESAHATFFLASDYVSAHDLERLTRAGHEVANHLREDKEYASLAAGPFREVFQAAEQVIAPYRQPGSRRWYRAPQGLLTGAMVEVLEELNVSHALGDCYADDWAIEDPELVADLYLRQVDSGSILIMHMPERGFREHTYETLRLVLQGLRRRGLRPVTLGELDRVACASRAAVT